MKYNYIDLFSGAGGMSLGFDLEGFKNVFSVEYDLQTAQTYRYNFPNHVLINKDIQEISTNEIKKIINNNTVDVIIGGPPCQGFSLAGKFGRTFIDDPRNQLFKEYLRFVSILKPKIFIIEFNYPEKLKRKVTIKEAISDLPPLKNGEKSKIPNHFAMNHSQEMLYKMSFISDGGNRLQIPEEIRPKSGDARKYIKYKSDEPSIPVTGDMRKVFHYSQNRALTSRELARIQTFPDDFIFKGTSINVQQQIGNAVPPKLAKLIAYQVNLALSEGR